MTADAKYLFAITAIRCMAKQDPGKLLHQNEYYQCMCDAGVPSYCSRVDVTSTARPSPAPTVPPTPDRRWPHSPYDDLDSLFKDIDADVYQPQSEETGDHWAAARSNLDSGMMWVGLLAILTCVVYLMYRCKCSGDVAEVAGQPAASQRRRSSARSAAEAAAAAHSGAGAGGGGGGPSGPPLTPPPPPELPPPYDLVYEQDAEPPSYETAIQEEAKNGADFAV